MWAADVPTMAYMSTRSGSYEIWLHRAGQVDAPLLMSTDLGATHWLFAPSPSPNGTRVIFQAIEKDAGSSSLWMVSVADGALERVTNGVEQERAGAWSSDGRWYAFSTTEPDGSHVLKKVRTTGRASPETVLAGLGAIPIPPAWSPDGEWILVASGGLKLIAAQGAEVRDLGIEDSPCVFARAEDLIYCLRAPQRNGMRSWVALDFDGNVVRNIGSVPFARAPADRGPDTLAPTLTFSMSPDGNAVTYSTLANTTADLWLMEGLSGVELP